MTAERLSARLAAAALAMAAGGGALQAGDARAAGRSVCVTCLAPEARYRCEVTAASDGADPQTLSLLCAAKIAQDNGHGSCSVARGAQDPARSGPCGGPVKTYRMSDLAPPAGAADAPPLPPSDAAPAAGEPATLADMTQATLDKSRENARRAGEALEDAGRKARGVLKGATDAVDGAAERTLKCLRSGFGAC